jgi:hypothetical protein
MRIEIAGETFATKAAAEKRVRAVRDAYPDGVPLVGDDLALVFDLLLRHQNASQKIGVGVAAIRVITDRVYKTRCFEVVRLDGSTTDFSFKHCLTPRTPLTDFRSACRNAISAQVIEFKARAFASGPVVCALSGAPLGFHECQVDHMPPLTFSRLLREWVEANGVDPIAVQIGGYGDGVTLRMIEDPALHESWVEYHRANATLRLLSVAAHAEVTRGAE